MRSVLIVDDNAANLRVVVGHLAPDGMELITAREGETAVELARRSPPSLILLDIEMPGIDGYEVCRRLKSDPRTADIPVLFMTVRAEAEDKVRGFDLGAVDYLTKPLDPRELRARVHTHLELARLRHEVQAHNEVLERRVEARTQDLQTQLEHSVAMHREHAQLLEMVQRQSGLLQGLALERAGQGPLRSGRAPAEWIVERLALVHMHVEQAHALLAVPGAVTEEIEGHLAAAMELLEPAVAAASPTPQPDEDPQRQWLSPRESEVLDLIVAGRSTKEIAFELGVARTTVSTYRQRIMEKFGVDTLSALLRLTLESTH